MFLLVDNISQIVEYAAKQEGKFTSLDSRNNKYMRRMKNYEVGFHRVYQHSSSCINGSIDFTPLKINQYSQLFKKENTFTLTSLSNV